MRKALAALAAVVALGAAAPAQALKPCPSPRLYLIVCCPKPCPTVDVKQIASLAVKGVKERAKLQSFEVQNQQAAQLRATLGEPGERSSPRNMCTAEDTVVSMKMRDGDGNLILDRDGKPQRDEGEIQRAVRMDQADTTEEQQFRAVSMQFRNVSSADEMTERLAAAIDASSERGAKVEDAIANARDARDYVRRTGELDMVRRELDALADQAEWVTGRIRSTHQLSIPLKISAQARRRIIQAGSGGSE